MALRQTQHHTDVKSTAVASDVSWVWRETRQERLWPRGVSLSQHWKHPAGHDADMLSFSLLLLSLTFPRLHSYSSSLQSPPLLRFCLPQLFWSINPRLIFTRFSICYLSRFGVKAVFDFLIFSAVSHTPATAKCFTCCWILFNLTLHLFIFFQYFDPFHRTSVLPNRWSVGRYQSVGHFGPAAVKGCCLY